jgi:hypothetical protein
LIYEESRKANKQIYSDSLYIKRHFQAHWDFDHEIKPILECMNLILEDKMKGGNPHEQSHLDG